MECLNLTELLEEKVIASIKTGKSRISDPIEQKIKNALKRLFFFFFAINLNKEL